MRSRKHIYTRILAAITALTLLASVPIGSLQASAETQVASETNLLFEDKFDSYFNYNWTMTSRDIRNDVETDNNWASNYKKQIKTGGVTGSCMSVTRNGLGYVSLDTALFSAEGGALYSLDYFLRIENAVYDTFYGVRAYLVEYDSNKNVLESTLLATSPRENLAWTEMNHQKQTQNDTAYLQIQFWCGGVTDSNFTASFDNVSLRKITQNTGDIWNFELHSDSVFYGWNISHPDAVSVDTALYRNGTSSMHIVGTVQTGSFTATAEAKIPINANTRYIFELPIISRNSHIDTEGVVLDLQVYDTNNNLIQTVDGLRHSLRAGADNGTWSTLICGLPAIQNAAYVVPQLVVAAGEMDFHVDALTWQKYDGNALIEDFNQVDSDGFAADWETHTASGTPTFSADGKTVSISCNDGEGYISYLWEVSKEYFTYNVAVNYQAATFTTGWLKIRCYDYTGTEISNLRLTKELPTTNGEAQQVETTFMLSSAAYAVIELGGQGTGNITFDNVQITENEAIQRESIDYSHQSFTHTGETRAEFVNINGTQTLYINDQPVPNMTYVTPSYQNYSNAQADNYMHESGICVTRLQTGVAGESKDDTIWTGPNTYDFSIIDDIICSAIENHPDTYLMLQVNLDVPQWWKDQNPDELIVTSAGNETNEVSFASKKFADDSIAASIAVLEHVKQQSYANRIIGTVLGACGTTEWVWYGLGQHAQDYSTASQTAFREYLAERYGSDGAIQQAWNDSTVTLATAEVPVLSDRMSEQYISLLKPENNRSTLDFHDFMADVNVKLLKRLAAEVTEVSDDRWVVGAYYGYVTNTYYYGNANGTMHIAMQQALEDENLDFFCAPVLYNERYDGESGGYMQMIDSIQAHGKAVMIENDNRLCSYVELSTNFFTRDSVGPTYNVMDSISQIERDFANQITTQVGQWYFNMWGNFFLNEQFSNLIGDIYQEVKINTARPSNYQSDICYIIDEDMYTYLAYNSFYSNYDFLYPLLYGQRQELAKIGATYDMYYMSDLEKGLIPDYPIYMIMAPVEMDATERSAAETYLKNSGKTVIWQYISGASDRNTFSAENMTDAIGMDVELITDACSVQAQLGNNHTLLNGAEGQYYGISDGKKSVSPVAVVTDADATILGTLVDTGDTAFAMKDMGTWTSIYSAVPCIPAAVLRNILQAEGIHTYCNDPDSVIFASDKYVAINCAHGGEKTITLPENHSVYDVYNKKVIALNTATITVDMADNSTRLFRLMSPSMHSVYVETGNGGISEINGYHEYANGTTAEICFEADPGYRVKSVTVDGVTTAISGDVYTLTLKNISESHYITAEFTTDYLSELQVITDDSFNGNFNNKNTSPWSLTSMTSGSKPDTTNNWTSNYTLAIAESAGVDGTAAASLTKRSTGYAALTSQTVPVESGKAYRLAYSYKTVSLEGLQSATDFYGIHTAVEFLDANGVQVTNGWVILNNSNYGLGYTVSDKWNNNCHDFITPAGTASIRVYLCIGGVYYVKAQVLFDNIQIGAYPDQAIVNYDFEAVEYRSLGGRGASVAGPSVWNLMTTNSGGNWDSAGTNTYMNNYILSTHTESDGNQVMKLAPVTTTKGYAVAYSNYIPVESNTTYVFSYDQKIDLGEKALQGAKILFYYFDANRNYTGSDWYRSSDQAHDWQRMENTFTTRNSTKYVVIGLFMGGEWGKNEGLAYYYDNLELVKKPSVEKWNLTLGDSVGLNFYIDGGTMPEQTSVTLSLIGQEQTYSLKSLPQEQSTGLYILSVQVAAAQMTEEANVSVALNGSVVSSASYSVYSYGQCVLNNSGFDSATKKLVREMLNYGSAAQTYFAYEAEIMDSSLLSGAGSANVEESSVTPTTVTGTTDNVKFYGASLLFRSRTSIRFYFVETGNLGSCAFTADGVAYTPVQKDGLWYVEINEILPQNLDQAIELTVTDGEQSFTVTYGPMHYMVRKSANGSDTLKALIKAMYNYHLAAKAYINK